VACFSVSAETVPADWKPVKDSKNLCRIAVPSDWVPLPDTTGAAFLHDPTTAIAVVTSQPEQTFQPLTEVLRKLIRIPKDRILENSARRLAYQDKISRNPDDQNSYSASVPGNRGTCSCHVSVLPSISTEIAKKIVLSLAPVPR
jgi:hypothetical protein